MGYSTDVELPTNGADSGYGMTNGYSSDYVITDGVVNGVNVTPSYHNDLPSGDASVPAAAMLTYPHHYTPAAPMMTTVPYCAPLVTDPYIVQHAAVTYQQQVFSQTDNWAAD